MDVEEFAREFIQDVLAESDADGQFVEDVFFQKSCEQLMEAGELDAADRVPYRSPHPGEFGSTATGATLQRRKERSI